MLDCTSGYTKGRCHKCNIVWFWPQGKGRVKDTLCPNCEGRLRITAHYTRSAPWRLLPVFCGPRDGCSHYWKIAPPKGPTSQGVCLLCGSDGEFPNGFEWGVNEYDRDAGSRPKTGQDHAVNGKYQTGVVV